MNLHAANGHSIPYDKYMELKVNLTRNDSQNLARYVPFLVSQLPVPQTLRANVFTDTLVIRTKHWGGYFRDQ